MSGANNKTIDGQTAISSLTLVPGVIKRVRLPYPVRELALIQHLLRRDMARQHLSLRKAAKTGPISVGSLSALLDPDRITDGNKQPKRPMRLPTLLHIRNLSWASPRTHRVIEGLLAADRPGKR
jgi:hypothetical protein